jgi:hypothetical protein
VNIWLCGLMEVRCVDWCVVGSVTDGMRDVWWMVS